MEVVVVGYYGNKDEEKVPMREEFAFISKINAWLKNFGEKRVANASALQVLRRLGSIFTSVYAAKLKRVVSLLEGLQGEKRIALYSPDNEEDTRTSQEYMNDLEEEYQVRALLAKSKRHCWSKTSVPSYQSHFQPKLLHSSEYKPEPRHTKDFEDKYNNVKAKLAFLNSSASAPSSSSGKNIVKALLALADEERVSVAKESARNDE
ncbi:hypothetical protein Tco_1163387 [Tanacetum coccineum]